MEPGFIMQEGWPRGPRWSGTSTKADRKRKKVERQNRKRGRKLNK